MKRIYTITTAAGDAVAFAEAVSQAEALRLYVESLGLSARASSAIEVAHLRQLPLLQRADTVTADLQFDAPDA